MSSGDHGDHSDRSGHDGGHHHRSDRATAVRKVPGHRISTADTADRPVQEILSVVLEAPTTIDVQGVGAYTLLCTPDDNRALAVGFLLTEGIVDSLDEVGVLRECEDDPSTIRVTLTDPGKRRSDAGRNLLIVSSCGLCGVEALDEKLRTLPPVGDTFHLDSHTLWLVGSRLGDHQPLFRTCGGTHAAGIFNASGEIFASAEDAGRHNALDKAIGRCLMMGRSTAGCGAVLSGRVSLEMVSKCARAGIELISAISAPTSLAIEVAERCGITLCVFVREERATVLTHAGRITTHPR
jgi:FdhD protein